VTNVRLVGLVQWAVAAYGSTLLGRANAAFPLDRALESSRVHPAMGMQQSARALRVRSASPSTMRNCELGRNHPASHVFFLSQRVSTVVLCNYARMHIPRRNGSVLVVRHGIGDWGSFVRQGVQTIGSDAGGGIKSGSQLGSLVPTECEGAAPEGQQIVTEQLRAHYTGRRMPNAKDVSDFMRDHEADDVGCATHSRTRPTPLASSRRCLVGAIGSSRPCRVPTQNGMTARDQAHVLQSCRVTRP
jgi:hypothetical protein